MKLDAMILPDGREVIPIHLVYFDEPDFINPESRWRVACMPNLTQLHALPTKPAPFLRSDDPRATTCPSCRETPQWRRQTQELTRAGVKP